MKAWVIGIHLWKALRGWVKDRNVIRLTQIQTVVTLFVILLHSRPIVTLWLIKQPLGLFAGVFHSFLKNHFLRAWGKYLPHRSDSAGFPRWAAAPHGRKGSSVLRSQHTGAARELKTKLPFLLIFVPSVPPLRSLCTAAGLLQGSDFPQRCRTVSLSAAEAASQLLRQHCFY